MSKNETLKVLVTGGGGFIGSHLVESQLAQGNLVRTIDLHFTRLAGVKNHQNLELIEGDITNPDQTKQITKGVDVVYHLASAHLDVSLPQEHYQRVNVDASLDLLEFAHKHGVKRFVHCSSVGVIGDVLQPPADETTECRPTNIYEQTKLEGEQKVVAYAQKTGFCVVVARPAWVYGPRCPRTEKLLRTIGKGRFIIFGSGGNLRHPIYIADAVRGLELCAQEDEACGEVYILAGDEPVTSKELVRVVSTEMGRIAPTIQLPVTLGRLMTWLMELVFIPLGKQPPFSKRSMDFFLKNNAYDISKANRDLGFYPQVDLEAGIKKTIEWNKGVF
jgi:nucleoside-diphosphate-sugar epimerase